LLSAQQQQQQQQQQPQQQPQPAPAPTAVAQYAAVAGYVLKIDTLFLLGVVMCFASCFVIYIFGRGLNAKKSLRFSFPAFLENPSIFRIVTCGRKPASLWPHEQFFYHFSYLRVCYCYMYRVLAFLLVSSSGKIHNNKI
jgi:hypothetical protein